MGQIDGFLKFERELPSSRDPKERINDSQEIYLPFDDKKNTDPSGEMHGLWRTFLS